MAESIRQRLWLHEPQNDASRAARKENKENDLNDTDDVTSVTSSCSSSIDWDLAWESTVHNVRVLIPVAFKILGSMVANKILLRHGDRWALWITEVIRRPFQLWANMR